MSETEHLTPEFVLPAETPVEIRGINDEQVAVDVEPLRLSNSQFEIWQTVASRVGLNQWFTAAEVRPEQRADGQPVRESYKEAFYRFTRLLEKEKILEREQLSTKSFHYRIIDDTRPIEVGVRNGNPAVPMGRIALLPEVEAPASQTQKRISAEKLNELTALYREGKINWQELANCIGVSPDVFFPQDGSLGAAQRICAACVVREPCLEYALSIREDHGVWGGTSERQRRRILKARSRR